MDKETIKNKIKEALKRRIDEFNANDIKFNELTKRLDEISKNLADFTFKFYNATKINPKLRGAENGFEIVESEDSEYVVKFSETDYDYENSTKRLQILASLDLYNNDNERLAVKPTVFLIKNNNPDKSISITVSKKVAKYCMNLSNYYFLYNNLESYRVPENFIDIILFSTILGTCDVRSDNIVLDMSNKFNPRAFLVDLTLPSYREKLKIADIDFIFKLLNVSDEYFDYEKFGNREYKNIFRGTFSQEISYAEKIKNIFLYTQGLLINSKVISPSAFSEKRNGTQKLIEKFLNENNFKADKIIKDKINEITELVFEKYNEVMNVDLSNEDINRKIIVNAQREYLRNALKNALKLDILSRNNFKEKTLNVELASKILKTVDDIDFTNTLARNIEEKIIASENGKNLKVVLNNYEKYKNKVIGDYKKLILLEKFGAKNNIKDKSMHNKQNNINIYK